MDSSTWNEFKTVSVSYYWQFLKFPFPLFPAKRIRSVLNSRNARESGILFSILLGRFVRFLVNIDQNRISSHKSSSSFIHRETFPKQQQKKHFDFNAIGWPEWFIASEVAMVLKVLLRTGINSSPKKFENNGWALWNILVFMSHKSKLQKDRNWWHKSERQKR